MSQVHPQARTTPRTRAEIKEASASLAELAERYNVSKATARKWKNRDDVQDLSHRPHKLSTTLTPARCLRRHGVSNLIALRAQNGEPAAAAKTYKDYAPGFAHIDNSTNAAWAWA